MLARKDNWIPYVVGFKVVWQVRKSDLNIKVSHFIDNDLGLWRRGLVNFTFEVKDTYQILGIPLSIRHIEDK